mmetsp:Transcript_2396/g.5429  ORF Transcript_2396/g.5429 Transcript_2396/m.5429 type:complete len:347 (-) Transcript_2396:140-1180(-)
MQHQRSHTHLVTAAGGAIARDDVAKQTSDYEKYHTTHGGSEESRKQMYADMVNKYYNLATSFYEYGWGESFHFAHRWNGETLNESIRRHEHYLALKLGLSKGMKCMDLGCGVGGPLREIASFSGASVTGVNNNQYQVERARQLTAGKRNGLADRCEFVKADFMKLPFEDESFDAAYAIEATCHAPDAVACYKQIYDKLKPGALFANYEWCLTSKYDPENPVHAKSKAEIEIGNGLPVIRTTAECLEAMKKAGFEIVEEEDLVDTAEVTWYEPLAPQMISLSSFRTSTLGKLITRNMVWALETLKIAPSGTVRVSNFLETAADGLVDGGKMGIFTPMYLMVGRKPLK